MRVKYKELVELRFKSCSRTTHSMIWNHWIVINQNDSYYLVCFSLRSLINMEEVLKNTGLNGDTLIASPFCNLVVLVLQPEASKHIEMYANDTKVRKKKENILSGKHEVKLHPPLAFFSFFCLDWNSLHYQKYLHRSSDAKYLHTVFRSVSDDIGGRGSSPQQHSECSTTSRTGCWTKQQDCVFHVYISWN